MAEEKGWSREEVEATVSCYLEMLTLELQGVPYNKAESRRRLQKLLRGRTDAAIERKQMNISAVLIDMEHPYINGYKPLGNFQRSLLPLVVAEQLASRPELAALAEVPTSPPQFDDILARLVNPPAPLRQADRYREALKPRFAIRTDYIQRESKNRKLGLAGEQFAFDFEVARLVAARQERLAQQVDHVSVSRGDGLGYDIHSFENNGRERLVEVKTTNGGQYTPFYVTANEVEVSREQHAVYHLYRVYSFGANPTLYIKVGPVERQFTLMPDRYVARVG